MVVLEKNCMSATIEVSLPDNPVGALGSNPELCKYSDAAKVCGSECFSSPSKIASSKLA